ncbi:hypothetical protein QAD02_022849 [Eretmocerus hayati]|uniref:Uncharacterized protein n=1 Tax=Eretmocerus hayati TaxID=131215 RepID=A0ACC2PTY3_9HYME|nr:hypothetical protein QAD02_022849 [Eretmocerus hayati]
MTTVETTLEDFTALRLRKVLPQPSSSRRRSREKQQSERQPPELSKFIKPSLEDLLDRTECDIVTRNSPFRRIPSSTAKEFQASATSLDSLGKKLGRAVLILFYVVKNIDETGGGVK